MSNKDLIEDLNHLRIKYGTCDVYKTLMKLLREEYEELSSLFGVSSNTHPTSTFFATSPQDYYAEFMKASAEAAHDILQEYTPAPASFYDMETQSIEAHSIHGDGRGATLACGFSACDEFSLCPEENIDDMDLINQIFNNSYSAESDISPETPRGELDATLEQPLKIIQTSVGSADAPEAQKKKLLKKKSPDSTISVVKETAAPTKGKKTKAT